MTDPRPTLASKVATSCGFAAGYAAAVLFGYSLYLAEHGVGAPFWPASGVYLAALLLHERRAWPRVIVLVALVHTVTDCALKGTTIGSALAYFLSNTAEAVLGALVLRRLLQRAPDLTRLRDAGLLCALAGLLPATSLLGAGVLARQVDAPLAPVWQVWWLGDLLGILCVGGSILAWRRPSEPGLFRGGRAELVALTCVAAAIAVLVFVWDLGTAPSIFGPPTLLYPPLVWAALRYGPRGATTGGVLLAVLFLTTTIHGEGAHAFARMRELGYELVDLVLWVQLALVIATGVSLALAAATAERDREALANQRHRDEMAHADKLVSLGTLVSSVAHELDNRNQLVMLNLPALEAVWRDAREVLDEAHQRDPELRIAAMTWPRARADTEKLLHDTAGAVERMRGFVAELRDYGRGGAREQRPFDLDDVVLDALVLLDKRIAKATRRFALDLAGELPPVMGDPRRMEQVVVNLVLNACEALTDRGQEVVVRTRARDGSVVLAVRDGGAGMTEEQLARVRDPFFTTKLDGTGLGVAVTAQIVEEHGGRLEYTSSVGQGTTAEVTLPIQASGES